VSFLAIGRNTTAITFSSHNVVVGGKSVLLYSQKNNLKTGANSATVYTSKKQNRIREERLVGDKKGRKKRVGRVTLRTP